VSARTAALAAAVIATVAGAADVSARPAHCRAVRADTAARGTAPGFSALLNGKIPVRVAPLRARGDNLRRENAAATRDGLSRLANARDLSRFRQARLLVAVPPSTSTYYVSGVPEALRLARPWTKRFIEALASAKHRSFGTPLRITGLTRTRAYQRALGRSNGNAAPPRGDRQSTHLTGASVDISKRWLSGGELRWLRAVLRRLTADGLIHAIEEFRQPHFHVLVRKRYGAAAADGC
jgi:hypothetical protein